MSAVGWAEIVSTIISTSGNILIALINMKVVRRKRRRAANRSAHSGQVDALSPRRQSFRQLRAVRLWPGPEGCADVFSCWRGGGPNAAKAPPVDRGAR